MKNPKFLIISAMILFFCSPNNKESGNCKDPGSCNNCIRIYDSQGNYVNGGPLGDELQPVYWDGKDCNGDSVACGKYQVEYVYQGHHLSDNIIIKGPGAIIKHNRSSCDSLKKACSGFFYEEETVRGYTCMCCQ